MKKEVKQREIKFRAWSEGKTMFPNSKRFLMVKRNFGEVWNRGESLIWMQYTGLKDKNGKEIGEGDIVKDSKGQGVVKCENWIEFFIEGDVYEDYSARKEKLYMFEVIGNIYENPELLTPNLLYQDEERNNTTNRNYV